jgi:hypothetical protein
VRFLALPAAAVTTPSYTRDGRIRTTESAHLRLDLNVVLSISDERFLRVTIPQKMWTPVAITGRARSWAQ